ncbi:MAG: histidine phosphatase family protein [Eubacteriales bacterium]|nr:histidine phosphatase family protein [Eubacteriales bacterium]
MRLYVIRHGETGWNALRKLQGQQGADLNEKGIKLAEMTAEGLKDVPFDLCYSSPLIRARHTADILLSRHTGVPVIEEERLKEVSFGVWEGKCVARDRMEVPAEQFDKFRTDTFRYVPPQGGESAKDVIRRSGTFFDELIIDPRLQDKTILIAAHAFLLRAFLHRLYKDPTDFWNGGIPVNCAVSIVDVNNGVPVLVQDDGIYYPIEYCSSGYKRPTIGR